MPVGFVTCTYHVAEIDTCPYDICYQYGRNLFGSALLTAHQRSAAPFFERDIVHTRKITETGYGLEIQTQLCLNTMSLTLVCNTYM
jgi:hypothetical protein